MRWFFILSSVIALDSWACEPESYYPCSADESHFSIVVDSVQTTLSKDRVLLTVQQLPNHQDAAIQNHSDKPLYLITQTPDDSLPFIIRDKKKWYVQARYTSEPTSCTPRGVPSKKPVTNLEKINWDCAEQKNSCGELFNSNVLALPSESYPLGWAANGLIRGKIALPPITEQKFTQYFLYENKLEKVAMISTLSLNEDYLKVTCDKNAKIQECGLDCLEFTNTSVAIKNPVSDLFALTTAENNFADLYELQLTIDGDFKDRLKMAGYTLAKNGVTALTEIVRSGRLEIRPFDYILFRVARQASEELTNLIGPGWSFHLRKYSSADKAEPTEDMARKSKTKQKRAPSAFHPDIYVIVDSDHTDPSIRQYAADFLKKIRNSSPQVDCVFFEWDPGGNGAIKDYVDGKRSFEDAIGGERSRMQSLKGGGTQPILDKALLDAVREEKISAYAINSKFGSKVQTEADAANARFDGYLANSQHPYDDYCKKPPKDVIKEMLDKDVVARSRVMADNIDRYFQNGQCHGGLLVVGNAHIYESECELPSTPTIQEFLKMKNRLTALIEPQPDTHHK